MKLNVFTTFFFICLNVGTVRNSQLPWWPFNLGKSKENLQAEKNQKQVDTVNYDPKNRTEHQPFPPLPWIFSGSPNPSDSKTWFLEYFKKTLQNFRPSSVASGVAISQNPAFQPQRPSTFPTSAVNSLEKNCDTDKVCNLRLKSFQTRDPLFHYVYNHYSSMDPLLRDIYESSRSLYLEPPLNANSMMAPEVITFMVGLMEALEVKMALVIGVFTGLSVVAAALATNNEGRILAVENPEYLKYWQQVGYRFVKNTQLLDKIILQGATMVPQYLDSLSKTQPGSFDFIILDDYNIENYKTDYIHCFELLKPRGVMLINNVLDGGKVLSAQQYRDSNTKTIDDLNSKLRNDLQLTASLLPIGNGVMFITKK